MEDIPQQAIEQPPTNRRGRLWLVIALAVAGAALLVTSFFLPGTATAVPGIIVPSPTWAAFPTRAVVIPEVGPEAMVTYHLRIALLSEDTESAQAYWDERLDMESLSSKEWYLGATLALQQDDLDIAALRILNAIELDSANAQYWQALALIYRRTGDSEAAAQCLSIARTYAPDAPPLSNFDERWRTALQAKDNDTLLDLALLHTQEQPNSALNTYYTSKALLLSHEYTPTINALIAVITPTGEAPALLWYTLGEAYYAAGGYNEAITVFEVALTQYSQGDTSLEIALVDPLADLNWYLAQAYFYAGECVKAELVFSRWEETRIDASTWISRAVICQTPTPTPTPWILSQQSTPTPTP